MSTDSFNARDTLKVSGTEYEIHRLDALQSSYDVARLPYSIKVLLENALRLEDGESVTKDHIETIAGWDAKAEPSEEIPFQPARVLMQDFTGVPALVDLAAMRDAMEELGGSPDRIDPLVPVDLIIDHSVQVDAFGNARAFDINADRDYERNGERYGFLRWGQQAFDNLRVVPPATGICHQVNLEYLGQVTFRRERDGVTQAYPDTLVGTDSHTTMINGLGVLGWGVGGIEAEAAMLGQPISMLLPQVVGFKLTGELPEGATATDLVLTVTEMLREHGVVGKFVEFHGPGLHTLGLADRATIGNMSPEFGSTCAIFPVDKETLRYLEFTGRPTDLVELVDAYAREQGMFHTEDSEDPTFSETLELDLSDVRPSIAGPKRPQDRIALAEAKNAFLESLAEFDPEAAESLGNGYDKAIAESFPASDSPAEDHNGEAGKPRRAGGTAVEERKADPVTVTLEDGTETELDHGRVVIAAITSCTNTSNPTVMVGAGLLAKKAVERGLESKPWVKTSLAPGSTVVTDYLDQAGLTEYLDKLGFNLVGYGCTTCIGNSGPLPEEISKVVNDNDLVVCSVLSGNRNFEGRINQDVRNNYLASPPLCVAYALAGRMDIDILEEPLGTDSEGEPVFLRDLWPTSEEIKQTVSDAVRSDMFTKSYKDVFTGDDRWRRLDIPEGDRYEWTDSTYVQQPPYFKDMGSVPTDPEPIVGARVLAVLGSTGTTTSTQTCFRPSRLRRRTVPGTRAGSRRPRPARACAGRTESAPRCGPRRRRAASSMRASSRRSVGGVERLVDARRARRRSATCACPSARPAARRRGSSRATVGATAAADPQLQRIAHALHADALDREVAVVARRSACRGCAGRRSGWSSCFVRPGQPGARQACQQCHRRRRRRAGAALHRTGVHMRRPPLRNAAPARRRSALGSTARCRPRRARTARAAWPGRRAR